MKSIKICLVLLIIVHTLSQVPEDIEKLYKFLKKDIPINENYCDLPGIRCTEDNQYITSLKLSNIDDLNSIVINEKLDFNEIPLFSKLNELFIFGDLFNEDVLPTKFFEFPSIEQLDIHFSLLKEFPNKINSESPLIAMNLNNNEFQEFPIQFKNLKELNYLNLSNNYFKEIPKELHEFPVLKILLLNMYDDNIKNNGINSEIYIPKSLESIFIDNNNINSIIVNEQNCQLRTFAASCNNFTEDIFKNLTHCENLKEIYLRNNVLIKKIPSSIQHLTSLHYLDIGNADIKEISDDFYKLKNLKDLDLSGNTNLKLKIKNFPKEIDQCNFGNTNIDCIYPHTCKVLNEDIKLCTDVSDVE